MSEYRSKMSKKTEKKIFPIGCQPSGISKFHIISLYKEKLLLKENKSGA